MLQNLARAGPSGRRRALLAGGLAAFGWPWRVAAQTPARAPAQASAPLKVAFVYVSPIGDAGWTYQHEQGRLAMQRALGPLVVSTTVESVPEGADAERVMRDLVGQGHTMIFATSFGYLEPALRVAADHPEVKFEHVGGYKTAPNLRTYDARYYEGRYLAGLAAGGSSRSAIAGYVAGFPVPEVIQGINAFAIGMRETNSRAQVRVLWLDTWFDPAKEREAANSLVDRGADVLTHHSASPAVAAAAEQRGVKVVPYHSDMRAIAPHGQLTAVVHEWGSHYTQAVRAAVEGRWQPTAVWGGLRDGFIRLAPLDEAVPADAARHVDRRRVQIIAGAFQPFSGRLLDTTGRLRNAGGALSDMAIAKMDWFVEGVVGTLPKS